MDWRGRFLSPILGFLAKKTETKSKRPGATRRNWTCTTTRHTPRAVQRRAPRATRGQWQARRAPPSTSSTRRQLERPTTHHDQPMILNKSRPSSWIQRSWSAKGRCVLTTSRELPRASRSWAYGSAAQSDLLMSDVSPSDPDVHPIRFNASSRRGDRSHQHAQPRYAAHSRLPPANEGARNAFVISYSSRDFIILDQKFLVLR